MIEIVKQNIKQQIKINKTTTFKVCEKLNQHRNYIYRITDEVKAKKIIDIAKAIGCEPAELLKGV